MLPIKLFTSWRARYIRIVVRGSALVAERFASHPGQTRHTGIVILPWNRACQQSLRRTHDSGHEIVQGRCAAKRIQGGVLVLKAKVPLPWSVLRLMFRRA